jgi:hypothetical protein
MRFAGGEMNRKSGVPLRICIVYHEPQLTEKFLGGFEVIDFAAPSNPEVDWKWIDKHMQSICANLPFGG